MCRVHQVERKDEGKIVEIMDERKFSHVRIRGKVILVIGELYNMPWIYFHPDTPKKAVWLDPT